VSDKPAPIRRLPLLSPERITQAQTAYQKQLESLLGRAGAAPARPGEEVNEGGGRLCRSADRPLQVRRVCHREKELYDPARDRFELHNLAPAAHTPRSAPG
jgi:hypothetical protein